MDKRLAEYFPQLKLSPNLKNPPANEGSNYRQLPEIQHWVVVGVMTPVVVALYLLLILLCYHIFCRRHNNRVANVSDTSSIVRALNEEVIGSNYALINHLMTVLRCSSHASAFLRHLRRQRRLRADASLLQNALPRVLPGLDGE